jgi:glycosyltransferase involved in cell wall biosynthesis
MNILYISQWLSSAGGGGEVVFRDIAQGISKNGHQVHVIRHRLAGSKENNESGSDNNSVDNDAAGLHIHKIRPVVEGFPPSLRQNLMFVANAILNGSKIIRRHRIELIHVNNFAPVIAGSILSKLFGLPLVSTIHVVFGATSPDFWKKWSSQSNVSPMSSIIGPMFENLTIRIPVDTIHSVSNTTKKDILKVNSKSKVVVIPNGIDLGLYDRCAPDIEYQNYVVFIGRLVFNKNLETVISSFVEVVKNIEDAKLVVIGFGPMLEEWRQLAARLGLDRNVQFTEYIDQERKINILSKSSALVLPSVAEGMPVVVLEAFALYKPVLLSDIEPHHDIVSDGTDGFIIPAHDAGKWSEKIIHLLTNKKANRDMGRNARFKAERQFNMNKTLREIESLYHTCVDERNQHLKYYRSE